MHLRPLNEDTDGAIMYLACERVKTSYLGETGYVLKVAYGTRHACAKAVAIFHVMFCPTSIGLEDIGRLMDTRHGQLTLQGSILYYVHTTELFHGTVLEQFQELF